MLTDKHRWWRPVWSRLTKVFRRPDRLRTAQESDRALVLSLSPSRIPSPRQLKFLPRLISPRERGLIRLSLVVALICSSVLIGRSLSRHLIFVSTSGGTLTEAVVGAPQYLNPILARPFTTDNALTHILFRGLMRFDEQMRLVPDLAETLNVSADGKVYTVVLRNNLKWSDGTELDADDVRFTYETVVDPAYQSPIQGLFNKFTVTIPDHRTIIFTLSEAYEPFRASLTLGLLPSKHWLDQSPQTFSLAELNVKPVSNGPYKFQTVTKDRSGNIRGFTFVRNNYFHGSSPFINRLVIKVYPEETSSLEALTTGAVDSLGGLPVASLAKIKKIRSVSKFGLSQLTAIYFNQKNNPALKVKEVRQALAMAVDRPAIISSAFGGLGQPADGPLLLGQPGYAADIKRFGFDLAGANTLLDQAGWKRDDTGQRTKNKQTIAFAITTVDDPSYVQAATALAENWKILGAKVEVKTVGADRVQPDIIRPRSYDAFLFGQISNFDADPFQFWHSSQQRETGFALAIGYIKKVDQDLEAAQKAVTAEAHDTALRNFQTVIADEVPAIILTQSEYLYAHPKSLHGIPNQALIAPAYRYNSLNSWYLKTRLGWK